MECIYPGEGIQENKAVGSFHKACDGNPVGERVTDQAKTSEWLNALADLAHW